MNTLSVAIPLFLIPLGLSLAGCATINYQYPDALTQNALHEGRSLVFFEIENDDPSVTVEMRSGRVSLEPNLLRWTLVNTTTGESHFAQTTFDTANPAARFTGAAVPPGAYFLKLLRPRGTAWRKKTWDWKSNRYLLHVPEAGKAYYAGTFTTHCLQKTPSLFGPSIKLCEESLDHRIDIEDAEVAYAQWPEPRVELDLCHVQPIAMAPPENASEMIHRSKVIIQGPTVILPYPIWRTFDNKTDPNSSDYMARILKPQSSTGSGGSGGGEIVILAAMGLVAATDWAVGKVEDRAERSEWTDCFDTARKSIESVDIADATQIKWNHLSRSSGLSTENASEKDLRLQIDLTRILLRKVSNPETVCLEIAMRVTLGNPALNPSYEKNFVYTAEEFMESSGDFYYKQLPAYPWWETPADAHPTPRHIREFCSQVGATLMAEEINRGLDALLMRFLKDVTGGGSN